jgi:ribosomal protein L29
MGAPTKFTEKLGERICDAIATRNCSLRKLCKEDSDFPDESTIRKWLWRHQNFRTKYFEAKRSQIDISVEELDDTIEESLRTYYDERGNERIDSPSASIAIAKAQNRKWYASKLAPKIYGDQKLVEELQGDNEKLKQELLELRAQLEASAKKDY